MCEVEHDLSRASAGATRSTRGEVQAIFMISVAPTDSIEPILLAVSACLRQTHKILPDKRASAQHYAHMSMHT